MLNAYLPSWQNDVFVVAEPGDLANKFLQSVKFSLLSMMHGSRKKVLSFLANISTVADLVQCKPYFQVGNVVHRYIGRQTQVCVHGFCTPGWMSLLSFVRTILLLIIDIF